MGNTEQKAGNKLNVCIETEKTFYNSGSIINGVVFVDAQRHFAFDALYLRIEGKQFCKWFQGSSKNRKKYVGSQDFYIDEHLLCQYSRSLEKGRYSYPFSLELSGNIPGSFSENQYDAKIQYRLVAYFTKYIDRKQSFYYSVPLMIREPFRQDFCEYEGDVVEEPRNCFCCGRGTIYMSAKFSKNVCFDDEIVPIEISIDNTQCEIDVKKIYVCLVQYTFVSANNGVCRTYRQEVDRQCSLQSVEKGLKKENIQINFQIRKIKKPSAISTLVANYYRLEATADLGLFTRSSPSIFAPVFIMKKNLYASTKKQTKMIDLNASEYKSSKKTPFFSAPQFWFKMNRHLSTVNFKLEDNAAYSETAPIINHRD